MNSTLALISGLRLGLGLEAKFSSLGLGLGLETSGLGLGLGLGLEAFGLGLGLGLGLETPGLVNIPGPGSAAQHQCARRRCDSRRL